MKTTLSTRVSHNIVVMTWCIITRLTNFVLLSDPVGSVWVMLCDIRISPAIVLSKTWIVAGTLVWYHGTRAPGRYLVHPLDLHSAGPLPILVIHYSTLQKKEKENKTFWNWCAGEKNICSIYVNCIIQRLQELKLICARALVST